MLSAKGVVSCNGDKLTCDGGECGDDDGGEETSGGGTARKGDNEGGECAASFGGGIGRKAQTVASRFAVAVAAGVSAGAWCCETPMFVSADEVVVVADARAAGDRVGDKDAPPYPPAIILSRSMKSR